MAFEYLKVLNFALFLFLTHNFKKRTSNIGIIINNIEDYFNFTFLRINFTNTLLVTLYSTLFQKV